MRQFNEKLILMIEIFIDKFTILYKIKIWDKLLKWIFWLKRLIKIQPRKRFFLLNNLECWKIKISFLFSFLRLASNFVSLTDKNQNFS